MGKAASGSSAKASVVVVSVKHKKKHHPGDMESAQRWLLDRTDVERISPSRLAHDALKLDRMVRLMTLLGEPHRAFKSIHVAGTKGKGSTCEMTAACLEACGYTVGLYTSPHLHHMRERIRLNRLPVSEKEFVALAQRVAEAEGKLTPEEGEPTFFELTTAMAFCHFAEQAVDAAVIEVGLGGRLDSTNVITPEVCAITNLSLDHTQILGATVEKIAKEKAGIFKPGVAVVAIDQKPSVVQVLREEAARVGAPLAIVGKEIDFSSRFEPSGPNGPQMRVSVSGTKNSYEHLAVPLRGEHQAANCALALAILDALSERGFKMPEEKVTRGLATVNFPGRMELVKTKGSPRVLLDGAHNAESIKCLMKAVSAHLSYDSLVVVFGCAGDKDIEGMLKELALGADKVIFTRSNNARAADPRDLGRKFADHCGKMFQIAADAPGALDLARRAVGREDLVCVTGSFYLVGEARTLLGLK